MRSVTSDFTSHGWLKMIMKLTFRLTLKNECFLVREKDGFGAVCDESNLFCIWCHSVDKANMKTPFTAHWRSRSIEPSPECCLAIGVGRSLGFWVNQLPSLSYACGQLQAKYINSEQHLMFSRDEFCVLFVCMRVQRRLKHSKTWYLLSQGEAERHGN